MKYRLNALADDWDFLDFEESTLFFNCPGSLPTKIDLQAWGLGIHTSTTDGWPDRLKRPNVNFDTQTNNIYVASYSYLSITGVVGGELSLKVYDPTKLPGENFVRRQKGDELYLKRKWKGPDSGGLYKYEISCALDWPPGYCKLILLASGSVSVEFNEDDCIPVKMFVDNPKFYGNPR